MPYICDRCGKPMKEGNGVLYRTCGCKKSGYIACDGAAENVPLMPAQWAVRDEQLDLFEDHR